MHETNFEIIKSKIFNWQKLKKAIDDIITANIQQVITKVNLI